MESRVAPYLVEPAFRVSIALLMRLRPQTQAWRHLDGSLVELTTGIGPGMGLPKIGLGERRGKSREPGFRPSHGRLNWDLHVRNHGPMV
jgi:hypothetical protein